MLSGFRLKAVSFFEIDFRLLLRSCLVSRVLFFVFGQSGLCIRFEVLLCCCSFFTFTATTYLLCLGYIF